MSFKITPKAGPRYWAAIMIASMCGTNLGDIVPDVLKLSALMGLVLLSLMFALLVFVESTTVRGSESFYWIAILLVRAAATNIADYAVGPQHQTYVKVLGELTIAFVAALLIRFRCTKSQRQAVLPRPDALYWITMLIAGSLGTVMGDAIGHSFTRVQIGVPASAALATFVLALIWIVKPRVISFGSYSYWMAILAVRWWGTNVGDILAFLSGLLPSASMTGLALATLLVVTRARITRLIGST